MNPQLDVVTRWGSAGDQAWFSATGDINWPLST